MQYMILENEQGQLVFPAPPTPTLPVGTVDNTGQVVQADAAGGLQVDDATARTTLGTINIYTQNQLYNTIFANDNTGGLAGARLWTPLPAFTVTADGAGNIGVASDLIGAIASRYIDIYFVVQVNTTGSYTTKWCEDGSGTPGPGAPDYHTTGMVQYHVAGYPYIYQLGTVTDNKSFGYDAGVNGNWPNSAIMTISGWYRAI